MTCNYINRILEIAPRNEALETITNHIDMGYSTNKYNKKGFQILYTLLADYQYHNGICQTHNFNIIVKRNKKKKLQSMEPGKTSTLTMTQLTGEGHR